MYAGGIGPPAPAQSQLLGRGVGPPGHRPWPRSCVAEVGARVELAVHALLAEHLEQRDEAQPVAEVALQVGEALAHALKVLVAPARAIPVFL